MIAGCERKCEARGRCNAHYRAWRYEREGHPKCSVEDCNDPVYGKGWCNRHWNRWRKWGDPLVDHTRVKPPCRIEGCERLINSGGLCGMHEQRLRKTGSTDAPVRREPKGHLAANGYVLMSLGSLGFPDGFRRQRTQHRILMEVMLGRPLRSDETVHHINGDRSDNRPENLELWSSHQPPGQRVADKVAWAKEILALYGDGENPTPTEVAQRPWSEILAEYKSLFRETGRGMWAEDYMPPHWPADSMARADVLADHEAAHRAIGEVNAKYRPHVHEEPK